MSSPFARMTSNLLVRKGDAAPSVVALPLRRAAPHGATVVTRAPEPANFDQHTRPPRQGSEKARPDESEKLHRIRVALTTNDLQRIGIAAVKAGVTRQKIIHDALQNYLHEFAADLHQPCNCLMDESCVCAAADAQELSQPNLATGTRQD